MLISIWIYLLLGCACARHTPWNTPVGRVGEPVFSFDPFALAGSQSSSSASSSASGVSSSSSSSAGSSGRFGGRRRVQGVQQNQPRRITNSWRPRSSGRSRSSQASRQAPTSEINNFIMLLPPQSSGRTRQRGTQTRRFPQQRQRATISQRRRVPSRSFNVAGPQVFASQQQQQQQQHSLSGFPRTLGSRQRGVIMSRQPLTQAQPLQIVGIAGNSRQAALPRRVNLQQLPVGVNLQQLPVGVRLQQVPVGFRLQPVPIGQTFVTRNNLANNIMLGGQMPIKAAQQPRVQQVVPAAKVVQHIPPGTFVLNKNNGFTAKNVMAGAASSPGAPAPGQISIQGKNQFGDLVLTGPSGTVIIGAEILNGIMVAGGTIGRHTEFEELEAEERVPGQTANNATTLRVNQNGGFGLTLTGKTMTTGARKAAKPAGQIVVSGGTVTQVGKPVNTVVVSGAGATASSSASASASAGSATASAASSASASSGGAVSSAGSRSTAAAAATGNQVVLVGGPAAPAGNNNAITISGTNSGGGVITLGSGPGQTQTITVGRGGSGVKVGGGSGIQAPGNATFIVNG